jgi:ADP-ribosylation factor protein 6
VAVKVLEIYSGLRPVVIHILDLMGISWSKTVKRLFGKKEVRILMLGLDGAGKTTILYRLKLDQTISTIPTVGFNVETLQFNKLKLNVWDVGGQDKIRPLWRHYYTGSLGLLFVVDSQDIDRIEEAKQELHRILKDREMQHCVLLVLANKQDQSNAIKPSDMAEKLGLITQGKGTDSNTTSIDDSSQFKNLLWCVQPSCALTGEGLIEGLTWLSDHISDRPLKRNASQKRKLVLENRTVIRSQSSIEQQYITKKSFDQPILTETINDEPSEKGKGDN